MTNANAVDSNIPYVMVKGTGNGSYDRYTFTVTEAQADPTVGLVDNPTTEVEAPQYYTVATLELTGDVNEGDEWKIGLRDRIHVHTATASDTLTTIAEALETKILNDGSHAGRYTVDTLGPVITITGTVSYTHLTLPTKRIV